MILILYSLGFCGIGKQLYKNIEKRVDEMIENGLVKEVRKYFRFRIFKNFKCT